MSTAGGGRVFFFGGGAVHKVDNRPGSLACPTRLADHQSWEVYAPVSGSRVLHAPEPERPPVSVFFAAVPGTTIRGTSARPTVTGTSQTTGTTGSASGSPERFSPEPLRSRSYRACTFTFRAVHDDHGWGPCRAGRPIPLRHLSWLTYEGRQGPQVSSGWGGV